MLPPMWLCSQGEFSGGLLEEVAEKDQVAGALGIGSLSLILEAGMETNRVCAAGAGAACSAFEAPDPATTIMLAEPVQRLEVQGAK